MAEEEKEQAKKRISHRYKEMQDSETKFIGDLANLQSMIGDLQADRSWHLNPNQTNLMVRTVEVIQSIAAVHQSLQQAMQGQLQDAAGALQKVQEELVSQHAHFRTLSTCIMVILQKKTGGEVVGDRTVGNSPKVAGEKGAFVSTIMDLLTRPTRRLLQYQLYLDEIAKDAEKTGNPSLQRGVSELGEHFKSVATRVNESVRNFQRRERVQHIAQRVRGVPDGISLAVHGREFLLDDGDFREYGRAGYRRLYLFNDALLICKPGENLMGKLMQKEQDLKFKHLIPLNKVTEPAVMRPPKDPSSTGVEQLPYFEIKDGSGPNLFHHKDTARIEEWVETINKARQELITPTPAFRYLGG